MSGQSIEFSQLAQSLKSPAADFYYSLNISPEVKSRLISITHSDPSGISGFETPREVLEAATLGVDRPQIYGNVSGIISARERLVELYSNADQKLSVEHVTLEKGSISGIMKLFTCLIDEGDNAVLPLPCHHVYLSALQSLDGEARYYNLERDNEWRINFESLEAAINERTKIVVVLNPHNPCGSVLSKADLQRIVEICADKRVPILADEVYCRQVFEGEFVSLGEVAGDHPVFVLDSLDFKAMVPGWRLAWLVNYDRLNRMQDLRVRMNNYAYIVYHPATFLMFTLPQIIDLLTPAYFESINLRLKAASDYIARRTQDIPAVSYKRPQGSFVSLVNIDLEQLQIQSSAEFCRRFAEEEGVVAFPAEVFGGSGGFRLTLFQPIEVLSQVFDRLEHLVSSILAK